MAAADRRYLHLRETDMTLVQVPDPGPQLFERAHAAQRAAEAMAVVAQANIQAAIAVLRPIDRNDLLRESRTARLLARLETMPVIEQAKGIIMAQSGCTPDAAFEQLRHASQRANVPIRDLAARVVSKAAHQQPRFKGA